MNAIDEIPLRGMEGPYYSDQRRLLTLTPSKRFKPPRGTSYYNLHSRRQAGTSLPNTAVPWRHSGLDPESHSPPEDYTLVVASRFPLLRGCLPDAALLYSGRCALSSLRVIARRDDEAI